VAAPTPSVVAAKKVTSSIPIVMINVANPVGRGLVDKPEGLRDQGPSQTWFGLPYRKPCKAVSPGSPYHTTIASGSVCNQPVAAFSSALGFMWTDTSVSSLLPPSVDPLAQRAVSFEFNLGTCPGDGP
jgi:hypothetical protein